MRPPRLTAVKTRLTPRPIHQCPGASVQWQWVAAVKGDRGWRPLWLWPHIYAGLWLRLLTSQQVLSPSAVRRQPVSHVGLLLPRMPRLVIQHSICLRRGKTRRAQVKHSSHVSQSKTQLMCTLFDNSWNHKFLFLEYLNLKGVPWNDVLYKYVFQKKLIGPPKAWIWPWVFRWALILSSAKYHAFNPIMKCQALACLSACLRGWH